MSDLLPVLTRTEDQLLGTWTRRPALRAAWTPDPEEFFTVQARALADACRVVAGAGLSGDDLGVHVAAELARAGKLRLWSPGEPVLSHEDLSDPIQSLDRWRGLRGLLLIQKGLADALTGIGASTDLGTLRGRIQEALRASETHSGARTYTDGDLMKLAVDAIAEGRGAGSPTGFADLDRLTGGFRAGHVWVLGAPTNFGKSSIMLAMLDHQQRVLGRRAVIVTAEDAPELLATRLLCRRADLPGGAARDGRLSQDEKARAYEEQANAMTRGLAPVMIEGRGRDVEEISGDIRAAARAYGPGLVLVDYLQCIGTKHRSQDRRNEINHVARTLTDAIKTSGCAGVLASLLTGEDIRESRDVEHAAEVVLIGRKGEDGSMSLFLKKNKTGPKDVAISIDWNDLNGSVRTDARDDLCGSFLDVPSDPRPEEWDAYRS